MAGEGVRGQGSGVRGQGLGVRQNLPAPVRLRGRVLPAPRSPLPTHLLGLPLLCVLCGFLFFYGLNTGDFYRTESLRALVARQMLASGDWAVPRLYGEPLFTKPPGMYVAIVLASLPGGEVTEWSARLPSAGAAFLTVLLFAWYFGRQLGRLGGLIAGLVLPLSFLWLDKATAAEIDMLQVFWVTAAILFFLRALEEEPEALEREVHGYRVSLSTQYSVLRTQYSITPPAARAQSHPVLWWLLALLCVAGGVLTKWTAPVFFYFTALALLWRRRQLRLLLSRRHLVSAAVAATLCLAWVGVAISRAGWEPFVRTVGREAIARVVPSTAGGRYVWYEIPLYPFQVFLANLPYAAVALVALWPGFARRCDANGRRLLQALHCWLWPNLVFWALLAEHAPRHGFPFFPAVAGLAALAWHAWFRGRLAWPVRRVRPATVFAAALGLWLLVKLVHVQAVVPAHLAHRQPRTKGAALASLVPPGETLFVFRMKDKNEGIAFYYGRPIQRLPGPVSLQPCRSPAYCLVDEREWEEWPAAVPAEVVQQLADEQGTALILVRLRAA